MADKANKYPDNVPGGFYVDTQCIDCDLCRQTAPSNFDRNKSGGYSFVKKQPTTIIRVFKNRLVLDIIIGTP